MFKVSKYKYYRDFGNRSLKQTTETLNPKTLNAEIWTLKPKLSAINEGGLPKTPKP